MDGTKTVIRDARDFNREHHVVERGAKATYNGAKKGIELNREYDVTGKAYRGTKTVAKGTYKAAAAVGNFAQEHDLGEKTAAAAKATGRAAAWTGRGLAKGFRGIAKGVSSAKSAFNGEGPSADY